MPLGAQFPGSISTASLGQLRLVEWHSPVEHRHYEPVTKLPLERHGPVDVVVWPPKLGIASALSFAEFIDRQWASVTGILEELRESARPVVDVALDQFCDPDLRPETSRLLQTVVLTMIKLNADGDHEIQFHDAADLVGGHDLLIGLNHALKPTYAQFDG